MSLVSGIKDALNKNVLRRHQDVRYDDDDVLNDTGEHLQCVSCSHCSHQELSVTQCDPTCWRNEKQIEWQVPADIAAAAASAMFLTEYAR